MAIQSQLYVWIVSSVVVGDEVVGVDRVTLNLAHRAKNRRENKSLRQAGTVVSRSLWQCDSRMGTRPSRHWLDTVALIDKLRPKYADLGVARFANPDGKKSLVKQIDDITIWFDHIWLLSQQRKGPPNSKDTLIELNDEASILAPLMQRAIDGSDQISGEDERQIFAIHKDLSKEFRRYDDVMSGDIPMIWPISSCLKAIATLTFRVVAATGLPHDQSNIRRAIRCLAECVVKERICWYACWHSRLR